VQALELGWFRSVLSLQPAGQFLNGLHELGVAGWLVNARERRPGDGLGYTVRGMKLNIRLVG
jgi:hypothetical protein